METVQIRNEVVRASIDVEILGHSKSLDDFIYINTHWEDAIPMTAEEAEELVEILQETIIKLKGEQ